MSSRNPKAPSRWAPGAETLNQHIYSADMRTGRSRLILALGVCAVAARLVAIAQTAKPAITLDEYLNTTDISSARLSPDGSSAVIATDQPDWKNSVYRHDLWI